MLPIIQFPEVLHNKRPVRPTPSNTPLGFVGGPSVAEQAVKAGASIIVTGTIVEEDYECMNDFAKAVHWKV